MKLQFAGVGSAFTTQEYYQSNMVLTSSTGKRLLIDCGSDIRFSLKEIGLSYKEIDAVYISHCHADHVGGLEYIAFCRYFDKSAGGRPILYCERDLMKEAWESTLKGGLDSIEGKLMNLTDYFDCKPVNINDSFVWEGIKFTPVQTVHIMAGYKIKNSYGLLINQEQKDCIFITTDSQHCPTQIRAFYDKASIIFHDCETAPYFSGVHAHYNDLKTLPVSTKSKMWLYHYQPKPEQNPITDGFKGFVKKGQVFDFKEE